MNDSFFDSNILLYLQESPDKAARVEAMLAACTATISVQVLNEITAVMLGKFKRPLPEAERFLAYVRDAIGRVVPLDDETHRLGMHLLRRYRLSVYDAMIVAAALLAGCDTLYTEDMQNGLLVENRLRLVNPFADP